MKELPSVMIPEGRKGPWRIQHFTVSEVEAELDALRNLINGRNRAVRAGTYMSLRHDRRGIIMSDTPAERADHYQVLEWVGMGATSFLIHGLGLGMIATWLDADPRVERIDVVEIEPDVIELVAPTVLANTSKVTIHEGDAFTFTHPGEPSWDAAWHDIWDDISTENIPQMDALEERYAPHVRWQACWSRDLCEFQQGVEYDLLREVYRQRGRAVGDEAAASIGMEPISEGADDA